MNKRKKIFLWFAGVSGFLIILILSLVIFASKFIDMQFTKEQIVGSISQGITGRIDFQKVDLSFFPRPRITIREVEFSVPEKAEGTIKLVKIYPKLIPLLFGELKVGKLQMESPDLSFTIPEKGASPPIAEIEEKISKMISNISLNAPDLVILIRNGRVDLLKNNRHLPPLQNIDARIFFPSEELKITANLRSNFSNGVKIMGHFNQKDTSLRKITLDLEAREVDIQLTRDITFYLIEDTPIVQKIFTFIKGGTVPFISIHSQGNSIADLGASENLSVKGEILQGDISIPGLQLSFKDVKGKCTVSKGVLDGKNIEAKLDHAELREGKLKIGLKGANAPLHLDTLARVNLEELSHLLGRVVKDKSFLGELNGIHDIKGIAEGRLVLGESMASIKPKVEVSEFNLSAAYQRIPYSVEIKGGQFLYDEKKVQVKNLSGTVGKSTVSGLTAGLAFGNVPYLEITSGKSSVSLEEIYRWLLSYNKLQPSLKGITSLKGSVKLSSINFSGPLLNSQDWRFRAIGSAENIAIDSSLLPGMLTITAKTFEVTPEQLVFTDAQTSTLDSSYSISGVFKNPLKGLQNADITFNGAMGPQIAQWMRDTIKLPALRIDQRLLFSQSRLQWEKSGNVFFQGNVKTQNGVDVSIDVIKNTQGLTINKLLVDDGISRATLTFNFREKTLGLSFVGKMNTLTLAKLTTLSHIPDGFIQGNFRTKIDLENPLRSTAQGNLSGAKIVIPWKEKVHLTIENISLNADANRMNVESASVKLDDNELSIQGSMNFTEKGIATDMDITADRITWEPVRKMIERENKETGIKEKDSLWKLPVLGTLRVKSNNFIYDKLTASPLYADISLSPDVITVTVTKALVCGISTPGKVKISHDNLRFDFNPNVRGQELKPTLACLSDKRVITGRFDLDGTLSAEGKSDQLLQSLQGKINFSAKDGRIYKATILSKIFSLINITGIFEGGLPDLVKEGFSYHSLIIRGDIENGKIFLKEAVIDAPSMEMIGTGNIDLAKKKIDLKVLVAPLKTVDSVLRKIPLVRNIVGRNLVAIPIKVTGDLENPEVSNLSPSAVGSGLLGIMEKVLKAPVNLIQPIVPGDKNQIR